MFLCFLHKFYNHLNFLKWYLVIIIDHSFCESGIYFWKCAKGKCLISTSLTLSLFPPPIKQKTKSPAPYNLSLKCTGGICQRRPGSLDRDAWTLNGVRPPQRFADFPWLLFVDLSKKLIVQNERICLITIYSIRKTTIITRRTLQSFITVLMEFFLRLIQSLYTKQRRRPLSWCCQGCGTSQLL